MSARCPHYVSYYELVPKVYQANALDAREAISEFIEQAIDPTKVRVRGISTDPNKNWDDDDDI